MQRLAPTLFCSQQQPSLQRLEGLLAQLQPHEGAAALTSTDTPWRLGAGLYSNHLSLKVCFSVKSSLCQQPWPPAVLTNATSDSREFLGSHHMPAFNMTPKEHVGHLVGPLLYHDGGYTCSRWSLAWVLRRVLRRSKNWGKAWGMCSKHRSTASSSISALCCHPRDGEHSWCLNSYRKWV